MNRSRIYHASILLGFLLWIPALASAQSASPPQPSVSVPSAQFCEEQAKTNRDYAFTTTPTGATCTITSVFGFGGAANTQTQTILYDTEGLPLNSTTNGALSSAFGATALPSVASNNVKVSNGDFSCSFYTGNWSFNNCILTPFLNWLGSWFLTMGGALLRVAGLLFDTLIYYVVITFGSWVGSGDFGNAIAVGWTIFRDVLNVVIIGVLVFIALSIILGLKTFGQKRLVANVIIVAALLNFSLLFTKLVIDFSNFSASVFYIHMATLNTTTVQSSSGQAGEFDIASAFLAPMGITNIWQTGQLTKDFAAQHESGWAGFLYGLFGGTMLLWVAFIFIYGSYLIALRAVLFIILLLTSAWAFASYLFPNLIEGSYGFKQWWKALFNAAIFPPVLMLFLFISLMLVKTIAHPLQQNGQAAPPDASGFSSILLNASGAAQNAAAVGGASHAASWAPIFFFLMTTGVLFASFKISSKIASSIPGSDLPLKLGRMMSSVATSAATGTPGLALAGASGLYGRMRYGKAEELTERAKQAAANMQAARERYLPLFEKSKTERLQRDERRAMNDAARQMRRSEREAARLATRAQRVKSSPPVKAYGERIAKRAKEAAAVAKIAAPTPEMVARARGEASAADLRRQADDAKRSREAAEARADEARNAARIAEERARDAAVEATRGTATYKPQHDQLDAGQARQEEIASTIKTAFQSAASGLGDEIRNKIQNANVIDPDQLRSLRDDIAKAAGPGRSDEVGRALSRIQGEHASEMRQIQERIDRARSEIRQRATTDPAVQSQALADAQKNLTTLQGQERIARSDAQHYRQTFEQLTQAARDAARQAQAQAHLATESVAGAVAERGAGVLPDLLRLDRTESAEAAKKLIRASRSKDRQVRSLIQELARREEGEGNPS